MTIRIGKDNVIAICLVGTTTVGGVYVNPNHNIDQIERFISMFDEKIESVSKVYQVNTKIISTYSDIIEHFKDADDKYFITGTTTSKFGIINNNHPLTYFANKKEYKKIDAVGDLNVPEDLSVRSKIKLELGGSNISCMILKETVDYKEYVMYLDTPNPIKYIDYNNNLTNFKVLRNDVGIDIGGNLIKYPDLVEEPKILSEVFIDRGINSVFEKIEKIKNIENINDFNKFGNNIFKINSRGYNF